ncbi:MAG: Zn-ribbon domain-containing OB-fold protein [Chloroflexota bacterium]
MADYKKPLPKPDPITQPYWDSVKDHAMKIQKCGDTGKFFFYPRGVSPYTGTKDVSWEPVSGNGTIYAFTIIPEARRAWPGFGDDAPYVVAMVDLEEGNARLMTHIVNVEADPEHVKVGMPVKVVYDDVTDEITLPKFEPA